MSSPRATHNSQADGLIPEPNLFRLSGGLLVGGLLLYALVTMLFHPSGNEDEHQAIFVEYADSGAWVAIHLGQLAGLLLALGGLLVLYRALMTRGAKTVLARFAAAATITTAATVAVLQAVDGIALKGAVDAWVDSSGAEEATAFANAETVRWLEWGVQSYFRVLLGLSLVLYGAAIAATRLVPAWLGWVALLAGLLSVAVGIDVGYNGLESGFQDAAVPAFQLAVLVFAIGLLVTGVRRRVQLAAAG